VDIKTPRLLALLAGLALLLVIAAFTLSAPQANLLQTALIIAALGVSFQIIFGILGQLSLGHSALFGVGAYVYAVFAAKGLTPWLTVPMAVVAAGIVGALISATTARLGGAYFAVVTYALAGIFTLVVSDTPALGGSDGIIGVRSLPPLGMSGGRPADETLYVGACFLIVLGGFALLWRSRLGTMLETIRANPSLATALGVNPVHAVILATGVSGLFAGLVGAGFAQHGRFVSPEAFGLYYVITPLAAVAIGGSRHLLGALLGSIVVVVIPLSLNISPIVNQVLSGLLLTFFIIRFPRGIAGWIEDLWRRVRPPAALPPLEQRVQATTDEAAATTPRENIVEARGIHLRYGAVHAVRGVDLDLREGEVVGLIGANGAGKSSLVNALSGTVRMQQGTLRIGKDDATSLPGYARARLGLARTFQNVAVVDELTVRASMELAAAQGRLERKPADWQALARVLQACGLGGAEDRRVGSLSYLHRRLFSIAMALATEPHVLFLDEATAGLTAEERTQISGLIRSLAHARGIGIVVIEHDVGFVARVADRIMVMNEGAKIAEGAPREVLADSRVVESYLGSSWDVARTA
jgi:branched-chain amino acid transport system permease protein